MDPKIAIPLSDAIVKTRHPRCDYRTPEAGVYLDRLRPVLKEYVVPGVRALDLGCGSGKFTFLLEELGADAFGIDCSPGAVSFATNIAEEIGSRCRFTCGRFDRLPYPGNHFDLVIFPQNIVECSYHEMSLVAEQVNRCLVDGGMFLVEMKDDNTEGAYDPITGQKETTVHVPEHGSFKYVTTYWTIPLAKEVISPHIPFKTLVSAGRLHYLIFRKQPGSE